MKPAEVRLQASTQGRILDGLERGEQMRMSLPAHGPHHGGIGSTKDAYASDGEEERRDLYV